MAIDFESTSSQSLQSSTVDISGGAFTIATRFKAESDHTGALFSISTAASDDHYFLVLLRGTALNLEAHTRGSGTNRTYDTTGTWTVGQQHTAVCTWDGSNEPVAYLDADSTGSVAGSSTTPTGMNRTSIGELERTSGNLHFDGICSETATWNVILTQAEIDAYDSGVSPLLIRPSALVNYWPMIKAIDPQMDVTGNNALAFVGTPVTAIHPRVIQPSAQILQFPQVAVGGSTLHQTTNYQGMSRMNGAMRS